MRQLLAVIRQHLGGFFDEKGEALQIEAVKNLISDNVGFDYQEFKESIPKPLSFHLLWYDVYLLTVAVNDKRDSFMPPAVD